MFNKRNEGDEPRVQPEAPSSPVRPRTEPRMPAVAQDGPAATIGPSIRIKGELSGEEDLLVQGVVEGSVDLPKNLLTVGQDGQVNATVTARRVEVDGKVEGDISGTEQVVLRRSGQVRGNIAAPRVTLEDGCRFKGSIDMDEESGGAKVADLKPSVDPGGDASKRAGAKA